MHPKLRVIYILTRTKEQMDARFIWCLPQKSYDLQDRLLQVFTKVVKAPWYLKVRVAE